MRFHGVLADIQGFGDRLVGCAFTQHLQNRELTRSKIGGLCSRSPDILARIVGDRLSGLNRLKDLTPVQNTRHRMLQDADFRGF